MHTIASNGLPGSVSGLHDALQRLLEPASPDFESGGAVVIDWVETPLGPMVAGARAGRLCLFEFSNPGRLAPQIERIRQRFAAPAVAGAHPLFGTLRQELDEYFGGTRRDFSLPLDAPGTPFQERVWSCLLEIPYGTTISYEELARRSGAPPGGQRAVGQANGMNRLAILIPCHRVINKSGRLGGYGGELWRKEALLTLEGVRSQEAGGRAGSGESPGGRRGKTAKANGAGGGGTGDLFAALDSAPEAKR